MGVNLAYPVNALTAEHHEIFSSSTERPSGLLNLASQEATDGIIQVSGRYHRLYLKGLAVPKWHTQGRCRAQLTRIWPFMAFDGKAWFLVGFFLQLMSHTGSCRVRGASRVAQTESEGVRVSPHRTGVFQAYAVLPDLTSQRL